MEEYDTPEELAKEAAMIKNSRLYKKALANLQARYVQVLLSEPVGSLTATTAHASMKVLNDVTAELETFITDAKIRRK